MCLKESDFYICSTCFEQQNFKVNLSCLECGRRIVNKTCPLRYHSNLIKFLISFGNADNKNLIKILVIGKETAVEIFKDFGYLLGKELVKSNILAEFKNFYLTPVPVSKEKLLHRGYNHSYIFAQALAKVTNLKIFTGLVKIKETKDQTNLNHQERLTNLKNAFRVNGSSPQKVILVDDIKTTGSTLKECAKALKKKGTKEIFALTILK